MTVTESLNVLVKLVEKLGIPEYFDGMDDEDIIIMGLHFYAKHIEENLEGIKEDMEEGENEMDD